MYKDLQYNLIEEHKKNLIYEKRQLEMEHQLKLAELDALQKQVTPHFVFNVISSISRLISIGDYQTASRMLDGFASMMRYSVSNIRTTITLKQEMNYIQNYLSIQKTRFTDRIDYDINIDDDILSLIIPFFSLQPLVENAIEHGLLPLSDGGKVSISCITDNKHHIIQIKDNGKGMVNSQLEEVKSNFLINHKAESNNHIGLRNCYKRFKLIYGDNAIFNISSNPHEGTCIIIKIAKDSIVMST